MRTRSQTSPPGKRKKCDDSPALDAGAGSKRERFQNASEDPDQEVARHSLAKRLCSASAKNVITRKRKKVDNSPAHDDGARSKLPRVQAPDEEMVPHSSRGTEVSEMPCFASRTCREVEEEITPQGHAGGRTSSNTVGTTKPPFEGCILALPSKVVKPSASASKKRGKKDGLLTASEHGVVSTQGGSIKQRSSVFERNLHTQGDNVQPRQEHLQNTSNFNNPIHLPEIQIVDTAILVQESADTQFQLQKGHRNETTPPLSQEGPVKQVENSRSKGALSEIDNSHESEPHPGSCANSKKPNLCSDSAQKNKQKKRTKKGNSVPLPRNLKKPSYKGMRAAKLRWKQLMQSINNAKKCSGSRSAEDRLQVPQSGGEHRQDNFCSKDPTTSVDNCQSYKTQSLPKKRKRQVGHDRSAAGKRAVVSRKQQKQKVSKHLRRLLRWMKTWLTQAKFSQAFNTNDQNNNNMGEAFAMTEDERNAFAHTMVKSCQQNPNMRTLFLESVRTLTVSGLMHSAASALLQEESCEQAQNLMDAWAKFKEQNTVTKTSPIDLFNAVNQLHEQRGNLSTKLNKSEGSFELKQLDEKTWKLKLPILPEPKPIVNENLGQNDIPE